MKPAAGPEEPLQGTALGRLEQLRKAAVAGEEGGKGNAEHGVRRVGFAADRPGGPPLDREPAAMPLDRGIGRQVDPGLGAAAVADPDDRIEKADPLDKHQPLLLGLAVDIRPDRHMVGARLEDDRGRQRVGAAPPQPYRARIARSWWPCPRPVPRTAAACRDRARRRRLWLPAARNRRARTRAKPDRIRAAPRHRRRRATASEWHGRGCPGSSRPRSTSSLRPLWPRARRGRGECPNRAVRRGSCRALSPATGREDARRPSRN